MKKQSRRAAEVAKAKRKGGSVWIYWPAGTPNTGGAVEAMLRRYAIPVIDRQYAKRIGDTFTDYGICVPASQAAWAEYLMLRSGVVLSSQLIQESNAKQSDTPFEDRSLPPSWGAPSRPRGVTGWAVWFLGEVLRIGPDIEFGERSTKTRSSKAQR